MTAMTGLTAFFLCLVATGSLIHREDAALRAEDLSRGIPARSVDAAGGTEYLERVRDLKGRARDDVTLDEIRRGNVPPFLRELKPVRLTGTDRRGDRHEAVVWVTPDYLAVGSDRDFVRVPMGLDAAVAVGRDFGFTLPTRKIVDAIYSQSSLRLAPRPMTPGPEMTSSEYFWEHNVLIERQRTGHVLGELVSGHKKDLILTRRLLTRRGRVAIYGWHRRTGQPIQPVSTVHVARYADYSHGVRLVATTVELDGKTISIFDALMDPDLAPVFSYEGTIRDAARLMGRDAKPPRRPTVGAP
jgi:hypothetical protein